MMAESTPYKLLICFMIVTTLTPTAWCLVKPRPEQWTRSWTGVSVEGHRGKILWAHSAETTPPPVLIRWKGENRISIGLRNDCQPRVKVYRGPFKVNSVTHYSLAKTLFMSRVSS